MKRRMDKTIIKNEPKADQEINDLISQFLGGNDTTQDDDQDIIDIDPVEFDLYDDLDRAAEYNDQVARDWKIIDETEREEDGDFIPKKKQKLEEPDENILRLQNKTYFIRNHELLTCSSKAMCVQILGVKDEEKNENKYFISREDFFAITKFYPGQVLQYRLKWHRLEKNQDRRRIKIGEDRRRIKIGEESRSEKNQDRQSTLFSPLSKDDELVLKSKFDFRGASFYIHLDEISKKVEIPEIRALCNSLFPDSPPK